MAGFLGLLGSTVIVLSFILIRGRKKRAREAKNALRRERRNQGWPTNYEQSGSPIPSRMWATAPTSYPSSPETDSRSSLLPHWTAPRLITPPPIIVRPPRPPHRRHAHDVPSPHSFHHVSAPPSPIPVPSPIACPSPPRVRSPSLPPTVIRRLEAGIGSLRRARLARHNDGRRVDVPEPALSVSGTEASARVVELEERLTALKEQMRVLRRRVARRPRFRLANLPLEAMSEGPEGDGVGMDEEAEVKKKLAALKAEVRRVGKELAGERRLVDESLPGRGR